MLEDEDGLLTDELDMCLMRFGRRVGVPGRGGVSGSEIVTLCSNGVFSPVMAMWGGGVGGFAVVW